MGEIQNQSFQLSFSFLAIGKYRSIVGSFTTGSGPVG